MAAVSLFWDTNMTAMTSCENTQLTLMAAAAYPGLCTREAAGYILLLRFLIWDRETKWTEEITQLNY